MQIYCNLLHCRSDGLGIENLGNSFKHQRNSPGSCFILYTFISNANHMIVVSSIKWFECITDEMQIRFGHLLWARHGWKRKIWSFNGYVLLAYTLHDTFRLTSAKDFQQKSNVIRVISMPYLYLACVSYGHAACPFFSILFVSIRRWRYRLLLMLDKIDLHFAWLRHYQHFKVSFHLFYLSIVNWLTIIILSRPLCTWYIYAIFLVFEFFLLNTIPVAYFVHRSYPVFIGTKWRKI